MKKYTKGDVVIQFFMFSEENCPEIEVKILVVLVCKIFLSSTRKLNPISEQFS